jgi:uncharacterized protein
MATTSNEPIYPTPHGTDAFARNWRWIVLLGPLVYGAYRLLELVLLPVVVVHFELMPVAAAYPIIFGYGPAFVFLAGMFYVHRRLVFPDIQFVGSVNRRDVAVGVAMVTLVYLLGYGLALLSHQPREPIMAALFQSKTLLQIVVMIGSVLLLPPLVEELAFRHFLLSLFPFRANWRVATVAVCATALYFSHVHAYQYWTTNMTIFLVGVIFGIARIRSNGMVLPTMLHAYAIALSLAMDQLMARLAG